MKCENGKAIFKGVAVGRIVFCEPKERMVKRKRVQDTEHEIIRYLQAKKQAQQELEEIYHKSSKTIGEAQAEIFEVHAMLLDDRDFNASVKNMILSQSVNAEYAVARTGDNFASMFLNMKDEYFQARSSDIKDVAERVIAMLEGKQEQREVFKEPVIFAAYDLTPSQTLRIDRKNVLGFVTEKSSGNSHTAILARTMNIPAVTGISGRRNIRGVKAEAERAVRAGERTTEAEGTGKHYRRWKKDFSLCQHWKRK